MTNRCEDFPCCGHTDLDPCARQDYDNETAADFYYRDDSSYDMECDDDQHDCQDCEVRNGFWECSWCGRECRAEAHETPVVDCGGCGVCERCRPDEDVYWSGTGELMHDDSYIDYLNRY